MDSIIDFQKEKANKELDILSNNISNYLADYLDLKIKIYFSSYLLTEENLEFLKSINEEILSNLIKLDCLDWFSKNHKINSPNISFMQYIDNGVNTVLEDSLLYLKEKYKDKLE